MHAIVSRRTLIAAVVIVAAGAVVPRGAYAQQAQGEGKPPRPPQDAVLADNSVVEANVPYGDDELEKLDVYAPRGVKQRRSSSSSTAESGRAATRPT